MGRQHVSKNVVVNRNTKSLDISRLFLFVYFFRLADLEKIHPVGEKWEQTIIKVVIS
nr:MAG TPA: hypothetical protein [Caudoviricetes sp.]